MVLYSAAHGGFAGQPVPLGGGAAVCNLLLDEWERTRPFPVRLLDSSLLGADAPQAKDIVRFSEGDYARFCRAFERRVTSEIRRYPPEDVVVLANDISEGPDFAGLAREGYRLYTIYHVDVVAYISAIYLKGWISPASLARWTRRLPWMPDLASLIFRKQRASLEHSQRVIVPSAGMKETLLRSYPETPAGRISVQPWGAPGVAVNEPEVSIALGELRHEYQIPRDALIMLTLSRISPEKGQDLLLEALLRWERQGGLPSQPLWLFLCGEAAYMQGARFLAQLKSMASRLREVRVWFPGYLEGARKEGFLRLAHLYVFPSRHESYGLTLMEALRAGVPAVCLDHSGARELMRPEFGAIVTGEPVDGLGEAIRRMLSDPVRRAECGEQARAFAAGQPFSLAAERLAQLLTMES